MVRLVATKALIDGADDMQRIDVAIPFARDLVRTDAAAFQVVVLRLGGVLPPGVDAGREQLLAEILPIEGSGVRLEEIHPFRAFDIVALRLDLFAQLGVAPDARPHGQHQVLVHRMELVGHRLGIGVFVFVELHGVPAVFAPPLPVLHDGADRNILLVEPPRDGQQLVLRVEALAAVDVAEDPVRQRRDVAGQAAEAVHDGVGAAREDDVVES